MILKLKINKTYNKTVKIIRKKIIIKILNMMKMKNLKSLKTTNQINMMSITKILNEKNYKLIINNYQNFKIN
jgi:hypothetical protein